MGLLHLCFHQRSTRSKIPTNICLDDSNSPLRLRRYNRVFQRLRQPN